MYVSRIALAEMLRKFDFSGIEKDERSEFLYSFISVLPWVRRKWSDIPNGVQQFSQYSQNCVKSNPRKFNCRLTRIKLPGPPKFDIREVYCSFFVNNIVKQSNNEKKNNISPVLDLEFRAHSRTSRRRIQNITWHNGGRWSCIRIHQLTCGMWRKCLLKHHCNMTSKLHEIIAMTPNIQNPEITNFEIWFFYAHISLNPNNE